MYHYNTNIQQYYNNYNNNKNHVDKLTTTTTMTTSLTSPSPPPPPPTNNWNSWVESVYVDKEPVSSANNTSVTSTRSNSTTTSSTDLQSPTIRYQQQQQRISSPVVGTIVRNNTSNCHYTPVRNLPPRMTIEQANHIQEKEEEERLNTNHLHSATEQQVEFLSMEPALCFCRKAAHRSFSLEYGPVLECHNYSIDLHNEANNNIKNKYTCGFHVHEISWNKFCHDVKMGHSITSDYSELKACPLYNFTYCTMFYVQNQYAKVPPITLPDCFCGKSVKLVELKHNNLSKIYFACRNGNVEGAKKCSWRLEAKEVAFPKTKNRLHEFVDLETYQHHLVTHRMLFKKTNLLEEKKEQQEKERESHDHRTRMDDKSKHQYDLLATLVAVQPTSTNELIDFKSLQIHAAKEIEQEERQLAAASFVEVEKKVSSPLSPVGSLIVPTSVLAKKKKQQQQQPPILSRSSSVSTTTSSISCLSSSSTSLSSSTITTPVQTTTATTSKPHHHRHHRHPSFSDLEELRILNAALQDKIQKDKKESDLQLLHMSDKVDSSIEMLNQVEIHCQEEIAKMHKELEQETLLRLNSQERLSTIELDVVKLMNDKEKLTEELANYKEMIRQKYGKEDEHNKCKVCFHRSIEFILIPCYHYAYCQLCASKLKECAICRRPITSIQKIYNC